MKKRDETHLFDSYIDVAKGQCYFQKSNIFKELFVLQYDTTKGNITCKTKYIGNGKNKTKSYLYINLLGLDLTLYLNVNIVYFYADNFFFANVRRRFLTFFRRRT